MIRITEYREVFGGKDGIGVLTKPTLRHSIHIVVSKVHFWVIWESGKFGFFLFFFYIYFETKNDKGNADLNRLTIWLFDNIAVGRSVGVVHDWWGVHHPGECEEVLEVSHRGLRECGLADICGSDVHGTPRDLYDAWPVHLLAVVLRVAIVALGLGPLLLLPSQAEVVEGNEHQNYKGAWAKTHSVEKLKMNPTGLRAIAGVARF